ncbi:hypothetical protein EV182_002063, partial [Spiromyces aspiralis]
MSPIELAAIVADDGRPHDYGRYDKQVPQDTQARLYVALPPNPPRKGEKEGVFAARASAGR